MSLFMSRTILAWLSLLILTAAVVQCKVDLDALFKSLTNEEKCGQMTQVGFEGKLQCQKKEKENDSEYSSSAESCFSICSSDRQR